MHRLLATVRTDMRLQFRNGFYYVTLFVVGVWALLLAQLPAVDLDVTWLLPAMLLGNLVITTFYFVGGLVLLEKGEGTLEAQVVTPLRVGEYLAAKVSTLAGLALVENVALVALLVWVLPVLREGGRLAPLPLVAGLLLGAALFTLAGFLAVARYRSVNEYLFPSMLYMGLLMLPLFPYFGLGHGDWFYWHPLQAPLVLLRAAFEPVALGQLAYGLLYGALWLALLAVASRRIFVRFVIEK
jgi:fluoroquinolone transport system permease protein